MNFDSDQELEDFVSKFLINQGAVVEKNAQGFDLLLPEKTANLLSTPEYIRLKRESDQDREEDTYSFNYGSPLLDKMVDIACATVPVTACCLEFNYLKSQGFDKLITSLFSFSGSVGRVETHAETLTDYLAITCRYLAQSDEQKMGLLSLIFNLETGAYIPEMSELLVGADKRFTARRDNNSLTGKKVGTVIGWIERQARASLKEEIAPFIASMTRRFRRDAANLEEYYRNMQREMEQGLQRSNLSEQLRRDRQEKIALLPDELAGKKDDLYKKYSIKIKIEPAAAMMIRTPAVKLLYNASIGKKEKRLTFIYNPVTKSVDPLCCEGCGISTFQIAFCNSLHLLCPTCVKKCPVC